MDRNAFDNTFAKTLLANSFGEYKVRIILIPIFSILTLIIDYLYSKYRF